MDSPQLMAKAPVHLAPSGTSHRQHRRASSASNSRQLPQRWPLRVVDDNSPTHHPSARGNQDSKPDKPPRHPDSLYTTSPPDYRHGAHLQANRPRQCPVEPGYNGGLKQNRYDEGYPDLERRNARSYRDTTSEILSLYAASSPQAYTQTASTALADASRAYSMSAAYARQAAAQRYPAAIHASTSIGGLQRSRSPPPYPARLRRPGIRAASPALTEDGMVDYNRMAGLDQAPQRPIQTLYKPMYGHGPRRPPPLALRPDMNRSANSLPSGPSPGPSHYGTASGRVRTPSSSVSWASRPSDRYYGSSTDQSIRSASLTSIVEMYQRPMTAAGNGPPNRSNGLLYYDYSEEFKRQAAARADFENPVCPVPKRPGKHDQPMILREEAQSRMDAATNPPAVAVTVPHSRSGDLNSIDESCDSYLEDSQGDSIREIEKILANAISNAAADHNLMNTIRAADARCSRLAAAGNSQPATVRERPGAAAANSANDWAIPQKAWRQSKTIATEPSYAVQQASSRVSRTSFCKKDFALDPVFADFTSLLSSFERLAKSPFSRLSDEDEADEESKHLSRRLTLELLDRVAAEAKPYQRGHRRRRVTRELGISELSGDDSVNGNPLASEDTLVLAPEPLSPTKNGQDLQLMKALPPLPTARLRSSCSDDGQLSQGREDDTTHGTPQAKSGRNGVQSPQNAKSPMRSKTPSQQSPLKLKLRVNASRTSIDADSPADIYRARSQRSSIDEGRQPAPYKPPPRLKLKMSRTQLNQGQTANGGVVIRNNRLKQCNALADVAPSPRQGSNGYPSEDEVTAFGAKAALKDCTLEAIEDEARQPSSGTISDQFNLAYPPTPPETVEGGLQGSISTGKLIGELPMSRSKVGHAPSRRLRSKFSFLRPRTTVAVESPPMTNETSDGTVFKQSDRAASFDGRNKLSEKAAKAASTSAKSERVGMRMKRWATDAKRAVRLYVRKTLVRGPKRLGEATEA